VRSTPKRAPTPLDAPELPWYRSEAWLAVSLSAFIPAGVAVVVPQSLKFPLLGLSGVLIAISLAMFLRHARPAGRPPMEDASMTQ
jgi:hypothetical protein